MKNTRKPKTNTINDERGRAIENFEGVLERWKQYRENLIKGETDTQVNTEGIKDMEHLLSIWR